jgi:hypothetical protein
MRQQIENRLSELQTEFEVGQKVMAELEIRQANLRSTLLRIGGAIQVLEELLGEKKGSGADENASLSTTAVATQ